MKTWRNVVLAALLISLLIHGGLVVLCRELPAPMAHLYSSKALANAPTRINIIRTIMPLRPQTGVAAQPPERPVVDKAITQAGQTAPRTVPRLPAPEIEIQPAEPNGLDTVPAPDEHLSPSIVPPADFTAQAMGDARFDVVKVVKPAEIDSIFQRRIIDDTTGQRPGLVPSELTPGVLATTGARPPSGAAGAIPQGRPRTQIQVNTPGDAMAAPGPRLAAKVSSPALYAPQDSAAPIPPAPTLVVKPPDDQDIAFEQLAPYVQVLVEAYRPVPSEPGYVRVTIQPNEQAGRLPTLPKDVILTLDASGSMGRDTFAVLREAVAACLSRFNPQDRFTVVGFKADVRVLSEDLLPIEPDYISRAVRFVQGLGASGNTDIYKALFPIVDRAHRSDRPFVVFFVSDGQPTVGITDSRTIINDLTEHNQGRAAIFAVGAGAKINSYLLNMLAYRNKGDCVETSQRQEIISTALAQWQKFSEPLLMNLTADYGADSLREVYPQRIPDLYRQHRIELYARYDKEKDFTTRLTGFAGDRRMEFVYRFDLAQALTGKPEIAKRWAQEKIYSLIGEMSRSGDQPAIFRQITDLAQRYGIEVPEYGRR